VLATSLGAACAPLARAKAAACASKTAAGSAVVEQAVAAKPGKSVIQVWEAQVANAVITITHPTRCVAACSLVAAPPPGGSADPAFPATQTLRLAHLTATGTPHDARWVLRAHGFGLQQQAAAVESSPSPPHAPAAELLAACGAAGGRIPALDATPVAVERFELRSRRTHEYHLLRANTEGVRVHVDFDVLLLGLGLAQHMASSAAAVAAGIRASAEAGGAASGAPAAAPAAAAKPRKRQAATVVELRVQDVEAVARVGVKDEVSVTAGLLRASSKLKASGVEVPSGR
jgi:hypothetical protein